MRVADQIVQVLADLGVKHIFGIPGGQVDPVFDAINKQDRIKLILMRHEEIGAFAASGHAKLTGELAVCVGCQGPGAIHLINGLYDATVDRVPVLAITGQIERAQENILGAQDVNQLALFECCTIYNREARNAENAAELLPAAIKMAIGRRGAVNISYPCDVLQSKAVATATTPTSVYYADYEVSPSAEAIQDAAELIANHQKITILYGGGCRGAEAELLELAGKLQAPLVHTTRSKDILDNANDHYVGGIGLMGSTSGNHSITHCDLLIMVGSNFAFKEYYPERTPILQIDLDPEIIGRHKPVSHALIGHAKVALKQLAQAVEPREDTRFLADMRKRHHASMEALQRYEGDLTKNESPITPQALVHTINQHAAEDAIFCIDAGLEILWANTYLKMNGKQRLIWSWHLGSLNCAAGYSIGCQLAEPDRQVISLTGDGGFAMMLGDFATAVRYQLPFTVIVFNNRLFQFVQLDERVAQGYADAGVHFDDIDFAKFAEACGGVGYTVKDLSTLRQVLPEALTNGVPTILDVSVDPKSLPATSAPVTPQEAYNYIRSGVLNVLHRHRDESGRG